ncbi:MAG: methionine adenosyltransferase [Armatimonadetes bacterium]|nr:methionine adenosyltransferase [Candidatus Hippobium faecium]
MNNLNLFTSESVTNGHPDKVADQISDAVLDACLSGDRNSHVACETMVTTDKAIVCGEITSGADINIEKIVRETIKKIGYVDPSVGFSYDTCDVINNIHAQSQNINVGVSKREDKRTGAGDQGLMFGYATDETEAFMPKPIYYARLLSNALTEAREEQIIDYLMPDGKSQVTFDYSNNKIDTVVISTMHKKGIDLGQLRKDIKEKIIIPVVGDIKDVKIHINPCGEFYVGGPDGDTGLTGRKIIVDTYGGMARHGGGAFSGKDPSKVDRSAAYMMRYVAKNLVAAGLCNKCEIQVAYAIGEPDPVSILVNTFGTGIVSDEKIGKTVNKVFDLTPDGIIEKLDLLRPIYEKTAQCGHFGGFDYPWEKVDMAEKIKSVL